MPDLSKRTFIAMDIGINQTMDACLQKLSRELKDEKIKWVSGNKMHLTLKFLGNTSEVLIPSIKESLAYISKSFAPVLLTIKGVGVFKNFRDPKVIWFGIEKNPILHELKSAVDKALIPFGFEPEERNFSPHLTAGRVKFLKNNDWLKALVEEYNDQIFLSEVFDELIFYESRLKPSGPEYIPLGKFRFGK